MKKNIQNFKVYIINLDKDVERMLFMHNQMQNLDIEYERISAVHGKEKDFGDEYNSDLSIKENGKDMTSAEKGCAKSHKICYEKFLNIYTDENRNNIEYALILEDDVKLPFNFKTIIEKQIKINNDKTKQNKGFEYLLFNYPTPGIFFICHWLNSIFLNYKIKSEKNNFNFYKKIKFVSYSILKAFYILPLAFFEYLRGIYYKNFNKRKLGGMVRFYRPLYLAGAYLITVSGAEKLYELTCPIIYPADRVPDEAKKKLCMRFYAYAPLSVFQNKKDFKSNIGI